jgi:hypothetical protein
MYSIGPIHRNIKSASASPGRSHVWPLWSPQRTRGYCICWLFSIKWDGLFHCSFFLILLLRFASFYIFYSIDHLFFISVKWGLLLSDLKGNSSEFLHSTFLLFKFYAFHRVKKVILWIGWFLCVIIWTYGFPFHLSYAWSPSMGLTGPCFSL